MSELSAVGMLSVVLLPWFVGGLCISALGYSPRRSTLEWLGWSYPAGALIVSGVSFAWLWTPAPIDGRWMAPTVIAVAIALVPLIRRWMGRNAPNDAPATSSWIPNSGWKWERGLLCATVVFLALLTIGRAILASRELIVLGDEANLFAMRAKLLYMAGGFGPEFGELATQKFRITHPDYPLLSPLLHVWTFANAGEMTQYANRIPMQGFVLSSLFLMASALRFGTRPGVAAVLLACLFNTEWIRVQTEEAFVDGIVGWGFVGVAAAWQRWGAARDARAWPLMCLAFAVLLWAKNEGFMHALALLAAIALPTWKLWKARRPRALAAAWMLVPLAVVAVNIGVNRHFGFENDLVTGEVPMMSGAPKPFWIVAFERAGERAAQVFGYFWDDVLLRESHTGYLLVAFFVAACLRLPRLCATPMGAPALAVLLSWAGFLFVYLGTPRGLDWHLPTSMLRVVGQTLPLATLMLGILAFPNAKRIGGLGDDETASSSPPQG